MSTVSTTDLDNVDLADPAMWEAGPLGALLSYRLRPIRAAR